jgi:uncharacterized membrane protein
MVKFNREKVIKGVTTGAKIAAGIGVGILVKKSVKKLNLETNKVEKICIGLATATIAGMVSKTVEKEIEDVSNEILGTIELKEDEYKVKEESE